jgi:SAM-dependent methyltransferase
LWQQADALALPFPAAEYDVVACQFGVMFFPDKPAAFSEARRVLAPGGTLVMSIWDTVDTSDFAAAVVDGVHRLFPEDPPTFLESVPYAYADTDVVVSDLRAGGMDCVAVDSVTLQSTATAADVARGFCAGTPLRAQIEARGDLEATTAAVAEHVAARLGTGPVTGRMAAYVIEATPAAPSPGRRRAGADGP